MFYRVSTAVISPALVNDLGLSSGQLSDLSAVFFYAFAVSQIPIGVALDRVGSRITMAFLACAAVSGTLIFAMGQTFAHLLIGRILLGIGMSGNLMVLLALLAAWFPVNRFAFLSGVAVSIGAMGNLLAATPLALLSLWIGWRGSFLAFRGCKYGDSRDSRHWLSETTHQGLQQSLGNHRPSPAVWRTC